MSKIEWTDVAIAPVEGCTGDVQFNPDKLARALALPSPKSGRRMVFWNHRSDSFHESLTDEQIAAQFAVFAARPDLTFLVLTKRAARMRAWFAEQTRMHPGQMVARWIQELARIYGIRALCASAPLRNVWLGVSCEDQQRADERIPYLLQTPAAVRFVAAEPLLGSINLGDLHGIDWVIAGAESGPGRRPCELGWLRSLRDQCKRARVPFFLKQADICPDCDGAGRILILDFLAYGTCRSCEGSGQTGKVRKGCPELEGQQWAQMPEVRQ